MQKHCLKQIKLSVWWKDTFHVKKKKNPYRFKVMFVWWVGVECGARMLTRLPCLMSCTGNFKKKQLTVCQYCCLFSFKAIESIASNFFLFHCRVLRTLFLSGLCFFKNLFWLTLVSPVLLDHQNTSPFELRLMQTKAKIHLFYGRWANFPYCH